MINLSESFQPCFQLAPCPGGGGEEGLLPLFLAGGVPLRTLAMLTYILQPYCRVNTENPYPILDVFPDLLSNVNGTT